MLATVRARAYLSKLPPAIAGQRGHVKTFAAACRLVEFRLGWDDAWRLFCQWNQTHCQPPWVERDLRHKLTDAYRCTTPKPHLADPETNSSPSSPEPLPNTEAKSPALPFLRSGTTAEIAQLADLRGLARQGVALASAKGLLRFGKHRGRAAWFIVDASRRNAQARRLDGAPWPGGIKALNMAGSMAAWPVGIGEAANFSTIALVEGGPDLLAACSFIIAEDCERDCAPVAMLGGCPRIPPDALPCFAGKRVRIFPHLDATGDSAAIRWAEQLAEAQAHVDAFSLAGLRCVDGLPVKDLCDLAAIHADDFEEHRCLWNLIP